MSLDSALGVTSGGTGLTGGTSGGVLAFTGSATISSSAELIAHGLVLGGGAGHVPSTPVGLGTATTVLHGNATGAPSWSSVVLTTDVSGVLPIANGGTNSATALAGSSIMVSNGTSVIQGAAGTTTTVLHGNAGGLPTSVAVSLTADISGTLPVANGGTGLTGGTRGGILYFSAAGALSSSGVLGANLLVFGGGAGVAPSTPLGLGTGVQVLHGNAGGNAVWGAVVLTTDVSGTLPVANGGTGVTSSVGTGAKTVLGNASSYTATATGMTTSPTGTVTYGLAGNVVTIDFPSISGTSNATTFSITGAPTEIRPASSKGFVVRVQDNGGAIVFGLGAMQTTGVVDLFLDAALTGFTAAGTKSIAVCSASYTVS